MPKLTEGMTPVEEGWFRVDCCKKAINEGYGEIHSLRNFLGQIRRIRQEAEPVVKAAEKDESLQQDETAQEIIAEHEECGRLLAAAQAVIDDPQYPGVDLRGPQYAHDCDSCVFLGCYQEKDLYICPNGIEKRLITVLARNSSNAPDYISGLPFIGIDESLTEAARRAVKKGLLDPNCRTGRAGAGTVGEELAKRP